MAQRTLADLEQRVKQRQRVSRTKQSRRYHLARELGFSGDEAAVLQNWSEEAIRRIAKEKDSDG